MSAACKITEVFSLKGAIYAVDVEEDGEKVRIHCFGERQWDMARFMALAWKDFGVMTPRSSGAGEDKTLQAPE